MAFRRQRLVQVLPTPITAPGGMERVALQIAEVAASLGLETVAFDNSLDAGKPLSRRYPMLNRFATVARVCAAVRKQLRSDDLVISHSLYGAFLPRRRHAYLYHCTFAGQADAMRPLIHPLDYLVCRRGYGWLDSRSGRRALPVAVSGAVESEVRKYYGLRCRDCIPNGVDLPSADPAARPAMRACRGWDEELFVVSLVGRYEGIKGRRLLDRLVPMLTPRLYLSIVAPNLERSPWDAERVGLISGLGREALACHLAAVDAVLCLSRYESFGLTIAEAWSAGRPVIATNVGIVRELRGQEPSLDRLVVEDPDDVEGVLERIEYLRRNPELGERQVEWGRQIVTDRFSIERTHARYTALLEEIGA